jgi:hypothetical protein
MRTQETQTTVIEGFLKKIFTHVNSLRYQVIVLWYSKKNNKKTQYYARNYLS